jgi:hypothetical protein
MTIEFLHPTRSRPRFQIDYELFMLAARDDRERTNAAASLVVSAIPAIGNKDAIRSLARRHTP